MLDLNIKHSKLIGAHQKQLKMHVTPLLIFLICIFGASPLVAAPFTNCPSKAFLFQGKPVSAYGVNLVTGNFSLIEDDSGLEANINGLGFNEHDRYLYGFNTTDFQMVRLGRDFQATTLNLTGLPDNISFYVGDVANHHYYTYRTNVGFYKVDLSPLNNDDSAPLTAELITNTATVRLTDFAFHPNSKKLYGVDNSTGLLYQFNPDDGSTFQIGDTGEKGTFGAMYFDVNGYFYLSRNQDGQIYRINLSSVTEQTTEEALLALDVSAIKFADGPKSNQNDGARCASAPLIDEDTPSDIDFGDAPATYGTLLADNGARHQLDGVTYLGSQPADGDYDGYTGAESDDITRVNEGDFDDEDGIVFVTAIEAGLDTVINVTTGGSGVLNAWFDWNIDGDFDDTGEHIIIDNTLIQGENQVVIRVPETAREGASWSRFRYSQQHGLNYNGGSTSGEVEDHPIVISTPNLTYRYYPSEFGWVTLSYEDQWPLVDDYDMNDVIMLYRTVEIIHENKVRRIDVIGQLQSTGGDYHNGFAIQLENITPEQIDTLSVRLLHNNVKQEFSGKNGATTYDIVESDTEYAVLVVSQDLWKHSNSVCNYFRTERNCDQAQTFNFELSIPFTEALAQNEIPLPPYDPFIFATEGLYHGDLFNHPGRSLEIHLADKAPTSKFDTNYFGLGDDTSVPEEGRYFRNSNNLPWALEITTNWEWPVERMPLSHAFPKFQQFVESNGMEHTDWYNIEHADTQYIWSFNK